MRNKNWLQLPSGHTQVVWGPPSCSVGGSLPQVPVLSMGCSNLCPGTQSSSAFLLHQPRCLQGCSTHFASCSSLSKLPHRVFYTSLITLSQRHHQLCCWAQPWPAVGLFGDWLGLSPTLPCPVPACPARLLGPSRSLHSLGGKAGAALAEGGLTFSAKVCCPLLCFLLWCYFCSTFPLSLALSCFTFCVWGSLAFLSLFSAGVCSISVLACSFILHVFFFYLLSLPFAISFDCLFPLLFFFFSLFLILFCFISSFLLLLLSLYACFLSCCFDLGTSLFHCLDSPSPIFLSKFAF